MTREEHLEWSKERALVYVGIGELQNAVLSMSSDLEKYKGLECNTRMFQLGLMRAKSRDRNGVVDWVNGFK